VASGCFFFGRVLRLDLFLLSSWPEAGLGSRIRRGGVNKGKGEFRVIDAEVTCICPARLHS
jgi:hypothetical protein